jgi:hypothetical protein
LPAVDGGVEPVRETIALKARAAILLRDDVRALTGGEKGAKAARVVDVPVGVDRRMHGSLAPGPHRPMYCTAEPKEAWVDEQKADRCFNCIGIGEQRVHEDVGRDLLGRRCEDRRCGSRLTRDNEGIDRHSGLPS